MLVLAMQFSKGIWANRGPERNDAPAGEPARAEVGAPLQSGTEDGTVFEHRHREDKPTIGDDIRGPN